MPKEKNQVQAKFIKVVLMVLTTEKKESKLLPELRLPIYRRKISTMTRTLMT